MKPSYLLIVLLLLCLLPLPVPAQFSTCDIRGKTPTLPCNYCTLSPTITIGANSTLPPTPQTLSVGLYSTNLDLGTYSPSTTVATGATAGPVTIGINSPTSSPQDIEFGRYGSGNIVIGRSRENTANTYINAFTSAALFLGRTDHSTTNQLIIIGQNNAPPSPTPAPAQQILIGAHASSITMGIGPTAGPVTIGVSTPTPSPTQDIIIAANSRYLLVGTGTPTYKSNFVQVGQLFRVTTTPAIPIQYCQICQASDVADFGTNAVNTYISNSPTAGNIEIGRGAPSPTPQELVLGRYTTTTYINEYGTGGVVIADKPTAGPVTIGRTTPAGAPSLSGSNQVNLLGLYHYFYSGMCLGLNTGSPATLNCNYVNVRSNAGGGGSGTISGYNTVENRWYPPVPGHYMITVMGLIRPSIFGALFIYTVIDTTVQAQAHARTTNNVDFQTITASTIQTFNTVGSGDYIEIKGEGMWDDAGGAGYNVLTITRVA